MASWASCLAWNWDHGRVFCHHAEENYIGIAFGLQLEFGLLFWYLLWLLPSRSQTSSHFAAHVGVVFFSGKTQSWAPSQRWKPIPPGFPACYWLLTFYDRILAYMNLLYPLTNSQACAWRLLYASVPPFPARFLKFEGSVLLWLF